MIVLFDDIKKADARQQALDRLRSFLDEKEPQLVKFLQRIWNAQQRAITYKDLREAIMRGDLTPEQIAAWRRQYVKFVVKHVEPLWLEAMRAANDPITRDGMVWRFDADTPAIRQWCETEAAQFVTYVADEQIKAMRFVIRRATTLNDMNVDTLSHVLRPMVGLDAQQAAANIKHFETLINNGKSVRQATESCVRYAARQNRYRAYRIARTELSFAYNQGAYEGTQQAQAAGLLGHTVKKWCTADDERVCEICGSLEGETIEMDQDFYYFDRHKRATLRINPKLNHKDIGKVPPAHPHCRCTVLYVEVSPPIYMIA